MAGHHVELSAVFADSQVAASETLRTRVTDAADEQKLSLSTPHFQNVQMYIVYIRNRGVLEIETHA